MIFFVYYTPALAILRTFSLAELAPLVFAVGGVTLLVLKRFVIELDYLSTTPPALANSLTSSGDILATTSRSAALAVLRPIEIVYNL